MKSRLLGTMTLLLCATSSAAAPPRTAVNSLQHDAAALYADDEPSRARAVRQLIAAGRASVPLIDPFESGCILTDVLPARCRNFDRALDSTVTVLEAVATDDRGDTNPAKDLVWRMLHEPAVDVFAELRQRPEWNRTDWQALRDRAAKTLERLLAVRSDLGWEEASRRAVAHAERAGRSWHLLRNCAGATMLAGCNYGSYVFAGEGRLVSFRPIPHGDRDNFGAGVKLRLSFLDGKGRLGMARATGGYGGDLVTLTFYRLDDQQVPLCVLSAQHSPGRLLDRWTRYVAVTATGCRALDRDARVSFERLSE